MYITGENTVKGYACIHLVVLRHITGENKENSNAIVYLVVVYAYY